MDNVSLNFNRIYEKAGDIRESLNLLEKYGLLDDRSFLNSTEVIRSARYTFIVLVEAASNISAHLCTRIYKKTPVSYADSFKILGEEGFIDNNLAANLGKMAGFRNLLVHGYAQIDDNMVLEIIRNDLRDVYKFLETIETFITNKDGSD